jgi:hypothetical protein
VSVSPLRTGSSIVGRLLGNAVSESLAFAAGVAVGPVLGPPVQALKNSVNEQYPYVPPDAIVLSQGVAQGQVDPQQAAKWAAQHGIGQGAFDALVAIADVGPAFALLLQTWRRGLITQAEFDTGLKRLAIEQQWWPSLHGLKDVLLSPAELANARQQGFLSAQQAQDEAALQGITQQRADLQYELAGLPPGIETALELLRRGIIDDPTFVQIVREGHTKTKYTQDLLALKDRVLGATTWATLYLKGHITKQQMYDGGAAVGESPANMDLLYLSMGRPAAPGQLWTAAARGIDGPLGRPMDFAQFQTAIAESDIRPEYGPMLWAIRYLYPSLFQLTRLVEGGTIDVQTGADWATKARYAPEVVQALTQAWQRGSGTNKKGLTKADLATEYEAGLITTTEYVQGLEQIGYSTADAQQLAEVSDARRVRTARQQLIGRARLNYVGWKIPRTEAQSGLAAAGLAVPEQDELLKLWDAERQINIHSLTEAQVVKAYGDNLMDQPTAAARLAALGLTQSDIAIRLNL